MCEKVNRKFQGMPQSQTTANPRHQEEENKHKSIPTQNKQLYSVSVYLWIKSKAHSIVYHWINFENVWSSSEK